MGNEHLEHLTEAILNEDIELAEVIKRWGQYTMPDGVTMMEHLVNKLWESGVAGEKWAVQLITAYSCGRPPTFTAPPDAPSHAIMDEVLRDADRVYGPDGDDLEESSALDVEEKEEWDASFDMAAMRARYKELIANGAG